MKGGYTAQQIASVSDHVIDHVTRLPEDFLGGVFAALTLNGPKFTRYASQAAKDLKAPFELLLYDLLNDEEAAALLYEAHVQQERARVRPNRRRRPRLSRDV